MKHRSKFLIVLLLACWVLLSSCGGGGGGSNAAVLTILNDWTSHGTASGGQSEKLDLTDGNGFLKQELVINQDQPNLQATAFNGVSPGTYHLSVQLWSQRDLGGVQTGILDVYIVLGASQSLKIDVGNAITGLAVTPSTVTITGLSAQQFYAQGLDVATNLTFISPTAGTVTWQALGGVGTIDANGLLSAPQTASQINGSVRATYQPNNTILGAGAVTVTPFSTTNSKWTVIVYMNAANDLDQFSEPNVHQMETVSGTPANVRFVLQWKQAVINGESPTPSFWSTRRYLIANGHRQLIQDLGQGVDMGNQQTMSDFVTWASSNFPATRYAVVIWNHGNGWAAGRARRLAAPPTRGFSYDDDTQTNIDTWQLSSCFGSLHPDIVSWDCSLMQMAEVAYELRNTTPYVVGSELSPPGPGLPYDLIFANFRDNPDASTLTLAKTFVDGMITAYTGNPTYREITQSVFDTSQAANLATKTSALADQLIANKASITGLIPAIRNNTVDPFPTEWDDSASLGRLYRDLYRVCELLQTGTGGQAAAPAAVQTAASDVQTALSTAVPYTREIGSTTFHGLTVSFYDSSTFSPLQSSYSNLAWANNTHWDEWMAQSP